MRHRWACLVVLVGTSGVAVASSGSNDCLTEVCLGQTWHGRTERTVQLMDGYVRRSIALCEDKVSDIHLVKKYLYCQADKPDMTQVVAGALQVSDVLDQGYCGTASEWLFHYAAEKDAIRERDNEVTILRGALQTAGWTEKGHGTYVHANVIGTRTLYVSDVRPTSSYAEHDVILATSLGASSACTAGL